MKRGRRILLAVLGLAVVAVLVAALWPREREPEYKGMKLSEWLIVYTKSGHTNRVAMDEATTAVRHIGTNALPFLLRWLQEDQPGWRKRLFNMPGWFPNAIIRPLLERTGRWYLTTHVVWSGFEILGDEAGPAVPTLCQQATNWVPGWHNGAAINALNYVGDQGLPLFVEVLTNKAAPKVYRREAILYISARLANPGTNASRALKALLPCLEDPTVACPVASALGNWTPAPEEVVPALAKCLRSPEWVIRRQAAAALGEFSKEASSAVPDLLAATNDEEERVRAAVTNALHQIAPDVLKNGAH